MNGFLKIQFTLSLLFVCWVAQLNGEESSGDYIIDDNSSILNNFNFQNFVDVADNDEAPLDTDYNGEWELFSQDSGVSAMHSILLPINKVVMYDATIWQISNISLPPGTPCRIVKDTNAQDCWSHSIFLDIETGERTPLKLDSDTWCSSGALDVDGNLVSTGGDKRGSWTVRFLNACPTCDWREYVNTLKDGRWYATTITLGDGRFVIFGGRDIYSYEFIPAEGQKSPEAINFPFIQETKDPVENNLYPFVHLSTDGNLFIFANDRSILFDINNNKIIREYPVLPGGSRSYPSTGMSVLLPIKLKTGNQKVIPAEVLVCGGSTHDAFNLAETKKVYVDSLDDCNRLKITDDNPKWKKEKMPSPRILGDMIILPTGDVLMLNGAQKGSSGWGDAKEPNLAPVLYKPEVKKFKVLEPTTIARMYHSSSLLLPDGKILVAGSNTNNGYIHEGVEFPTELRVEKFSPPYLDPKLAAQRPEFVVEGTTTKFTYGQKISVRIKVGETRARKRELMVTMYSPPFTTHGVTMNQRLVVLGLEKMRKNPEADGTIYDVIVQAPPSGNITPQGYYLLFAVYQGIPSKAIWVQIK